MYKKIIYAVIISALIILAVVNNLRAEICVLEEFVNKEDRYKIQIVCVDGFKMINTFGTPTAVWGSTNVLLRSCECKKVK